MALEREPWPEAYCCARARDCREGSCLGDEMFEKCGGGRRRGELRPLCRRRRASHGERGRAGCDEEERSMAWERDEGGRDWCEQAKAARLAISGRQRVWRKACDPQPTTQADSDAPFFPKFSPPSQGLVWCSSRRTRRCSLVFNSAAAFVSLFLP